MTLSGKVALVTGAGSGIGKAAAVLLAQQGVRVAALSHTADEVKETVAEIERGGKEAMAAVADTTQEDQWHPRLQQYGGNSILSDEDRTGRHGKNARCGTRSSQY